MAYVRAMTHGSRHRVALAVKVAHFGAYLVKVRSLADSRLSW